MLAAPRGGAFRTGRPGSETVAHESCRERARCASDHRTVWLFDLDNTLHNASASAFHGVNEAMTAYIVEHLRLDDADQADGLRRHYWQRYGATLLGLVRHHGVHAPHFLHHTHLLPGLEQLVHGHAHDFAALARLPGRRYVLTNAPAAYTARVLGALGIARWFDGVSRSRTCACSASGGPSPTGACCAAPPPGCGCRWRAACWSRTRWSTRRRRAGLGMKTVWMQRWTRGAGWGIAASTRVNRRPAYVDRRISRLSQLRRDGR